MKPLGLRLQLLLAFLFWLSHTSLSASREAVNGSWLVLWYSLGWNPLFCECARGHIVALEPSHGKGLLFSFVSLEFPQFGLLLSCYLGHISPLRVSSGHSTLVLSLRTDYEVHASTPSPHLLWVNASMSATFWLVIFQCKFCGDFFFFFSYATVWDCKAPHWPCLWERFLSSIQFCSTQTHVHWVGDAIQPFHPLSSPSPPTFSLSQHQGPFQWVSSSHQVAKVL